MHAKIWSPSTLLVAVLLGACTVSPAADPSNALPSPASSSPPSSRPASPLASPSPLHPSEAPSASPSPSVLAPSAAASPVAEPSLVDGMHWGIPCYDTKDCSGVPRLKTNAVALSNGFLVIAGAENVCEPGGAWPDSVTTERFDPLEGLSRIGDLDGPRQGFVLVPLDGGSALAAGEDGGALVAGGVDEVNAGSPERRGVSPVDGQVVEICATHAGAQPSSGCRARRRAGPRRRWSRSGQ